MTGLHDPVQAKALWLELGERRICLVTTDLIGTSDEFRSEVVKRLPAEYRCDLIIAASHNHSGPGALTRNPWLQIAMGKFDPELYETYVRKITDLIVSSARARSPARVGFATGSAPDLQRNRRSKHYPGAAPLDPEVLIAQVDGGVLVNYAAHGTVLGSDNFLLSGDWPGAFQRALERKIAKTVLYANGAEGDLSPVPPGGTDDFERCERMGEALAARVESWIREVRRKPARRLLYIEEAVSLPKATLPLLPSRSVVGLLVVDETAFLCVPGEMCADLGLELKRRFRERGFRFVAILGLANDHLGYFLTEEQHRKGGYERDMSLYGSGMGPFLLEAFDRLAARAR